MMRRAFALSLTLALPLAHAQLADPTVPPAALRAPADGAAKGEAAAPAAPRLQSVLIAHGRKVAVIDGETVRLGEKHRGFVLARVTESEVVLERGADKEVLKLYPAAPARVGQR